MANKTAADIIGYFATQWCDDPDKSARELIAEASRQLYEATMLILDTTMKPSAEREELARRYSAFYGITESEGSRVSPYNPERQQ